MSSVLGKTPAADAPRGVARRARTVRVPCAVRCLAAALALGPMLADAHSNEQSSQPVYVTYVTNQGDTLYEIARRYLRDAHDWTVLSRLNKVPAPRHLQAGVAIRLPAALLRQDQEAARVVATSGPVERAFGAGPYAPLAVGMTLGEGDQLRTGHEGFVTLELQDGSHVTVSQDATVAISKLRETALTGSTDRVIQLKQGEVDSEVTHATRKDDRFQIRSPSVVAGVRGTRFRVDYDSDAKQTAVEVLDGAVGVDPASVAAPGARRAAASVAATRLRQFRQRHERERRHRRAGRTAARTGAKRTGQDTGRQNRGVRSRQPTASGWLPRTDCA